MESRDLKEGLTQSMWIVFVTLLLILMLSNFFMSKKIWSSFYRSIHKINRYDLTKNEFIQLQQIMVQKQIDHSKLVRMNPELADVLLRNLEGEIK